MEKILIFLSVVKVWGIISGAFTCVETDENIKCEGILLKQH
jgi:hypothetical protein